MGSLHVLDVFISKQLLVFNFSLSPLLVAFHVIVELPSRSPLARSLSLAVRLILSALTYEHTLIVVSGL